MTIKSIAFDVGGVLAASKVKRPRGVHEEMARNFHIDLDSWFDSIDSILADSIKMLTEVLKIRFVYKYN